MKTHAGKRPAQQSSPDIEKSNATPLSVGSTVDSILYLQRTVGNRAVQRLLHEEGEALKAGRDTSPVNRSAHVFSRASLPAKAPATLQAKLKVNTPGDAYEQEADRVAERVTSMPEGRLQRSCTCGGGGCSKCGNEQVGHQHLQTKRAQSTDAGNEIATRPNVHELLRSSGRPLEPSARAFFEPRFRRDFSHVRIHSGPAAEKMAESIGARAFTLGSDIVFGHSEYAPATNEGRRLLAHELAHTGQQLSNTIYRKIKVGGVETKASALLAGVTANVNTWYTGIVTTLTTQMGAAFNAARDMPFTQTEAVERAAQILQEMENAKFETYVKLKKAKLTTTGLSSTNVEPSREPYDFEFSSAQEVSDEVLFRLSLMLHMSLANRGNTRYARYPTTGETGLNLQDSTRWQPIGTPKTPTRFDPAGFQLQPGTTPSAAITQLTTPVASVQQRIVVDCSTMMGILHYKALEEQNPTWFNTKFQNRMIVGPLTALYGDKPAVQHPLMTSVYRKKSPYMKPLKISKLEDLVPGDTIQFVNYTDYETLAPGGLWTGEWGIYTRKEGKTLYFEGFGVSEKPYEEIIADMQSEYEQAWNAADPRERPDFKNKESSIETIEGKLPGISKNIFRIDLAEYNKP